MPEPPREIKRCLFAKGKRCRSAATLNIQLFETFCSPPPLPPRLPLGDFLCLSLTSGFVQLRFNLGNDTHVLQSPTRVDPTGQTWHTVRAGRLGRLGFLSLDGGEATEKVSTGMSTLDVETDVFVGGVPTLSLISHDATRGEPTGFTGSVRELLLDGRELELTETGAVSGANVGDWDGTACGYKVCRNGGRCSPTAGDSFVCTCPPSWTGSVCDQSVACASNGCKRGSLCAPSGASSYRCLCPLGWGGRYCNSETVGQTLGFAGDSYILHRDPRYNTRNLRHTRVSFSFSAQSADGLLLWMGRAEGEDDDYLAAGLERGLLKVAVNLGERLSSPATVSDVPLCCGRWHNVTLSLNGTVLQVALDGRRVLHQDLDPFERYVALDYGGKVYFGGLELDRNMTVVTSGLFSKGLEGQLRQVYLFKDTKPLALLKDSEGFNVYDGDQL